MNEYKMQQEFFFINNDASTLSEIMANNGFSCEKWFPRIFKMKINDLYLPWLVKTYKTKKSMMKELESLEKLKKTGIVPKVLVSGSKNSFHYIVISKIEGEDLFEHISKKTRFSEKKCKVIIKKILKAVAKIHKLGIVHGDLKPENIIYDGKNITIIDFEKNRYSEDFVSPEYLNENKLTEKSDTWAIGVMCYYFLTGKIMKKTTKIPTFISDDAKDFILSMTNKDYNLRYDIEKALNHVWIK